MRRKGKVACTIILVLVLAAVLLAVFGRKSNQGQTKEELPEGTGMSHEQDEVQEEEEGEQNIVPEIITVDSPVITAEMSWGADGPILDYADEHLIIFHDYCGLFAYDIVESRVIGAVDLAPIECEYTQGDHACEVLTDSNGWKVYLHPLNEEKMFVYDVLNNRLTSETYDLDGKEAFCNLEETAEHVDPQPYPRSFYCAPLGEEQYLYLESGSGMVSDLYYVIEQNHERVRFAKIFDGYFQGQGEIFAYADYTGYLDECADWSGYSQFLERDYDEDGLTDRVYRENISEYESCNYRIEFGNGDLIEIPRMGSGIPDVQRCDLDGDGTDEILFRQYYGFSTNPRAFGETAIFIKKNNQYEQLMPPQDLCAYMKEETDFQGGSNRYQPCLTFCYEKQSEWEMRVMAKELAKVGILDEMVSLNDDLAAFFNQPDSEREHVSVCYETTVTGGGKSILEFHFQVFNKWALDEVVVTAAYENGELQITGSRYESEADKEAANPQDYDIAPEDAVVIPEMELLTYEEAENRGTVREWEDEMLPGAGLGVWNSVTVDGVTYFYGKYDHGEKEDYALFSWVLQDDSRQLANGLKVGMSRQEALKVCPQMVQIGFEGEGWPAWNGNAYPDDWTDMFDDILIANIENQKEDPPVFLALMMKSDQVVAITQYEPTAG